MSITLDDLAEMAGLAKSTVSRALSGRRRVTPEIAKRVKTLARQHGYSPHGPARALARGRHETYAIAWVDESRETDITATPSESIRYITVGAERWYDAHHARNLMLMQWKSSSPEPPKAIAERWVDGIIVAYQCPQSVESCLLAMGLPGVAVNCESECLPSVRVDDVAAAAHAVEYLHGLGHRRIAYVGTPVRENRHPSTRDRVTGYVSACRKLGLVPSGAPAHIDSIDGQLDVLLGSQARPTALLCYADDLAINVVHGLLRRGVRVPEDLSVMGFDDAFVCQVAFVPLTTMKIPFQEMGMRAAAILEALIEKPEKDESSVVLQGELVERASTGPPPAR